ncbi:WHG domain-containing protein [Oscillatoria sp. FACHB-1407]|uniref:TetR/AcrR family transcriptional regulator n=1 Tax=Oscillatoria sp. FACHB-1407 TaxID=2692847 RepID=UPI001688CAA1|nr:TetR/AcrR family transcriptional regulator [Oscillatoria sp. FACHB-1407]MBD2463017.1 WHG domain-containing protein [Oscillatoria sp. FACHB-1407]
MGRPPKEKSLTQRDIIEAAIACVEAEGETALGVNRVARELGITPPSIYKHVESGAALRRLVALEIWRRFLSLCCQSIEGISDSSALLKTVAYTARNYARSQSELYRVMTAMPLQPSESDCAPIVQSIVAFYQRVLQPYKFTELETIHAMRMLNAAFYGFVATEQAGLLTLEPSPEESYEVIINALIQAIQYIRH